MSIQLQIGADVQGAVNGINRVNQSLAKMPAVTNQATQSMTNLSRIVQDAPYGFIGVANNINPLLESFQRLKTASGSTGAALKAMGSSLFGAGGLGLVVGTVSSLLVLFGNRLFGAGKAAKDAAAETTDYAKAVKEATANIAQEAARVEALVSFLKQGAASTRERAAAIKELKQISPEYFGQLETERLSVEGLSFAYNRYVESLKRSVTAKVLEKQLGQAIEERLRLERELGAADRKVETTVRNGRIEVTAYNATWQEADVLLDKKNQLNKVREEENRLARELGLIKPSGLKLDVTPDKVTIKPKQVDVVPFPFTQWNTDLMKVPELDLKVDTSGIKAPGLSKSFLDAVSTNKAQIKDLREELEKLISTGQFLGNTLADAFGNIFDAIATGGNAFKALGNAIKQVVSDLIKAAIQAFIVKSIVNLFAPGAGFAANTGGIGALIGRLPGNATGGAVHGPTVVGEQGPEIFVPSTSGRIVPNNRLGSLAGMGGQNITIGGEVFIDGQRLRLVLARTDKSQNRN